MSAPSRQLISPRLAGALAVVVLVLIAYFAFLRGGSSYTINAEFRDAGQLITGDLVEVGGLPVGKIAAMRLTPDGNAELELRIDDSRFNPLHQGTKAMISTVGLAGIANRFVSISPGPQNEPAIPSGSILDETNTHPIVDLDELLNSLTPPVRADLQSVFSLGARAFVSTAAANQAFLYANPAFAQTAQLLSQIVSDRNAFSSLISASATVASTLAAHDTDLESGTTSTARALRAIASQSAALADSLSRSPGVLAQATSTFQRLRSTLVAIDPTIRAAQPLAKPLAATLRQLVPTGRHAIPVLAHLLHTLPAVKTALDSVPALRDAALPTLSGLVRTLHSLLPIATALRPYAPDVVAGLQHGLGGQSAGNYDANGHYADVGTATGPGGAGDEPLNQLLDTLFKSTPVLNGFRTGLTARCPGGGAPPAQDNSNPFIPDPSVCNPAHDATPDH